MREFLIPPQENRDKTGICDGLLCPAVFGPKIYIRTYSAFSRTYSDVLTYVQSTTYVYTLF